MNIVLLSGGSGKRLWPLSNDVRSKQFIKLFKASDGSYESMVQRMYHKIKEIDINANITIATSKAQVSAINNHIGQPVNICVEPSRKDTFPAIALAISYLHDVKGVSEDEAVIVCPVDPFVESEYFLAMYELEKIIISGNTNLALMGIEPTYPSEKYGYIIPASSDHISDVTSFKEKPDIGLAETYISNGALWNSGVFAFKIKYLLAKAHELISFNSYQDLRQMYDSLDKISFDYAVVERESNITVMRFSGKWKDLGTWNTLTEEMVEYTVGNAILNDCCDNTHIINELNIPILCMGIKDAVISASPEGILVADKTQSSYIKPYVDGIEQEIMFAEKSWGSYTVIDVGESSLTIKVILKPGNHMNYHSHKSRDEVWIIISGEGITIMDGFEKKITAGDVITMRAGCKHTIFAETELEVIEVQIGKEINVHDKEKHEYK